MIIPSRHFKKFYLYINLACLFVCLFVCLYPINVKTAEPIGPKFFVGHLGTPGKVYESSKLQIFVSIKIRFSLNFWKFWKFTDVFVKIRFLFCFTMYTTHTAENGPSGFKSKHLLLFLWIMFICRLLSYILNFQKIFKKL